MGDLIGQLLSRLTGREWRLYFVKKGVLQYALRNKGGFQILAHLHPKFESGQRISNHWKFYIYYTGARDEEHFQLTEATFTTPALFDALDAKCRILDKNWDRDAMQWSPYFVHVPTRKRLPLGWSFEIERAKDASTRRKYIEKKIQMRLAGENEGFTFSKFLDEVLVRKSGVP
jgi:hypothetical protein